MTQKAADGALAGSLEIERTGDVKGIDPWFLNHRWTRMHTDECLWGCRI